MDDDNFGLRTPWDSYFGVKKPEKENILLGATSIFFVLSLIALFVVSRYSFLLFHVLSEFFSIAVATATFLIAWNTRQFIKSNYLLFLGIAYLFVGFIDLLHTLSYSGMGVFPEATSNMPTQLWLAGRYMEAGSLLIAPFLIDKVQRPLTGLIGFSAVTAILLISIFTGIFPDAFIQGSGLTNFKIFSEYAVCVVLLVAAWLLWRKREHFERSILNLVLFAIAATICAELSFTFYIDVYGLSNLLGHFFKIISFFLIYLAVIHKGLTDPYSLMFRRLAEHERILEESQAIARVGGWVVDLKTGKSKWTAETYRLHEVASDFEPDLESGLSFFQGENRTIMEAAVNNCATQGEPFDEELQLVTARGNTIWVRVKARCILDVKGLPDKLAGIIQDVTDWKEMQQRLEKATEEANAANRAKSDFLANMSHELRTPLTGIMGMLELAGRKAEDPKQRERIGHALSSSKTLLDIINDVLDLSKIEAGVLEFHLETVNLRDVIDLAVNTFVETAHSKGLDMNILVDESVPYRVVGDSTRIRQVLFNLLGNAVKFTESGRIELEAKRIDAEDDDLVRLHFRVSDTGPGIREDMLDAVFEKFTQGEQGRRAGGTGLGLSIVKRLVNAMGGDISVQSRIGQGATFSFDLKLQPAPEGETRKEFAPQSITPVDSGPEPEKTDLMQTHRVLVVEDDAVSRMVVVRYLQELGHEAKEADNGESALAALNRERFDAVLLDLNLPDMEGLKVFEQVRMGAAGAENGNTPFIALTGRAMDRDEKTILEAGLNGYLAKPLSLNALRDALVAATA